MNCNIQYFIRAYIKKNKQTNTLRKMSKRRKDNRKVNKSDKDFML